MKQTGLSGYSPAMKQGNEHMVQVFDWALGDAVPAVMSDGQKLVAAIGNFDGVHLGHQQVISKARQAADEVGLPLAILTFSPHPRAYFRPDDAPFLLMDRQAKIEALAAQGADMVVHIAFTAELQSCSAEGFVRDVLARLGVVQLFAGADFAFGRGRSGDMDILAELGTHHSMAITPVSLVPDEHSATISSSRIRAALQSGQIALASSMLGHDPVISGPILQGDQRGRLLSFPTANLSMTNLLAPAFGVYAVEAQLGEPANGAKLYGVANIGVRPTVNDRGVLCEVHLFDFDQEIYGERLTVYVKDFIRSEAKFNGLEELKAQIAKDVEAAKRLLPQPSLTA